MLDYNTDHTPPFPEVYTNLAQHIARYRSGELAGRSKLGALNEVIPSTITQPLSQLTLNEYLPGQGIAAHIDTESCFGPEIFVISLGSGVTMTMMEQKPGRSKSSGESQETKMRKHVYLKQRSLLILKDDARFLWSHMIAPRKNDKVDGQLIARGRRVSLTFRQALFPGDIPGTRLCSSGIEEEHVFKVYDSIALHWHHTRGKRKVHWHRVKAFIETIEAGSFVADIGSGDGKYFGLSPSIYSIGCDRSIKLLEVSRDSKFETFCCDAVKLPLRTGVFDAVLCIAVLHHIATIDRRVSVIRELLRICRPGGRVMLQAWALEQEAHSKKKFDEQDVLVPWKLQVINDGIFAPSEIS